MQTSSHGLETRLIVSESDWNSIRADWEDLYARSACAVIPLSFDWLRTWWNVYGSEYGRLGLRILSWWRGSRLIGVLPLYQTRGRYGVAQLRFISTGEAEFEETCPDYMNLMCLPGEESACADAAWLGIRQLKWDCLELMDLPSDAFLARSPQLPAGAKIVPRGRCPIADLTGGFEAYLGRLSANTRGQARRLIREGERAGVRFALATAESAPAVFDEMAMLHQSRWTARGKVGAFGAPRFLEFHRSLIATWINDGTAVLAQLSRGSNTLAVLYGFVRGPIFSFYQAGVRVEDAMPLHSPGNLAHLLLIQYLAGRGVITYDFLRGSAAYKERLARGANELITLRCWRESSGARARRALVVLGKIANRGRRALQRKRL